MLSDPFQEGPDGRSNTKCHQLLKIPTDIGPSGLWIASSDSAVSTKTTCLFLAGVCNRKLDRQENLRVALCERLGDHQVQHGVP